MDIATQASDERFWAVPDTRLTDFTGRACSGDNEYKALANSVTLDPAIGSFVDNLTLFVSNQ